MTAHRIVPPYLLEHLERTVTDPQLQARYRHSRELDARLRTRPAGGRPGDREGGRQRADQPAADGPQRVVHDAGNGTDLPGRRVRSEGEPPGSDAAVNEAFDGTGATWTMFSQCLGRNSIDGAGLPLSSTVHFDRDYANAFWDGAQMVFGDGDGVIFRGFTGSVDVTGHELAHGVTQYTADLAYEGQSGALNESLSDVFGSLAKQHHLGQTTDEADWVIGADLFQPDVNGIGLRSLKAPGTAYDDPRLGKDPQPAHLDDYVTTTEDNGGVHINSGIPNRAFHLAAAALGGHAYDDPGKIWYQALTSGQLGRRATFADFAQATLAAATELYGADSRQLAAVASGWAQVGVEPSQGPQASRRKQSEARKPSQPPEPSQPHEQPASSGSSRAGERPEPSEPSAEREGSEAPGPSQPTGSSLPREQSASSGHSGGGEGSESADLMRAAHVPLEPSDPPAPPPPPPPERGVAQPAERDSEEDRRAE